MSEDRAALLVDDVLATPSALDLLLATYSAPDGPLAAVRRRLAPGPRRRVVLAGMGSSRFAALAVAAADTVHVELASARTIEPAADIVFVGISNSGRTPEVVEAVRHHRGRSLTIGLTNHPDRAVGEAADLVLPLVAGDERSGIASRTYAATVTALALLAAELSGGDAGETSTVLREAVGAARSLRAGRAAWLGVTADALDGADEIHIVGDGREIGALEQAALMLREGPRLRALPMDAGDWLHVGLYTLLPGGRAILFSGTPYDAEIAGTVARRGGRLVVVGHPVDGEGPAIPLPQVRGSAARAIVTAGVAELIAAELWARTGPAV